MKAWCLEHFGAQLFLCDLDVGACSDESARAPETGHPETEKCQIKETETGTEVGARRAAPWMPNSPGFNLEPAYTQTRSAAERKAI